MFSRGIAIFWFCLKAGDDYATFASSRDTAFHRTLFVPSCCSSSCLKVGQGGGTVTSHYVDIGRKKRKERPLGRERWWLIFVQTRLQTVWRERFRTIFKVASGKKERSPPKNREPREDDARLRRNVIRFWCSSWRGKTFSFHFSAAQSGWSLAANVSRRNKSEIDNEFILGTNSLSNDILVLLWRSRRIKQLILQTLFVSLITVTF